MRALYFLFTFLICTQIFAEIQLDRLRVVMWNSDFSRDGPGVFINELIKHDPLNDEAILVLRNLSPDILLLTDFDQDPQSWAARLVAERLGLPHYYHGTTLRGVPSGFDLNRDNRFDADDALGFGTFHGQHGMAIFSKYEVKHRVNYTNVKWSDVEDAQNPKNYFTLEEWRALPLFTSGIWDVTIKGIHLVASYATTPAFDGVEDRNGIRNTLENQWLDGYLRGVPRIADDAESYTLTPPFIALGTFNLDPDAGDGDQETMQKLLANPKLQDFGPRGPLGLATADWRDKGFGALRADYILPSCGFSQLDQGMLPIKDSAHFILWLDLKQGDGCK